MRCGRLKEGRMDDGGLVEVRMDGGKMDGGMDGCRRERWNKDRKKDG